eukprot:GAHX01001627.1.p1 GENE.GAHX01001627.1~~GAHX01001627.1.p1  ORF type:complete len:344 (-),score=40.92 GAHX01001627.1:129-1160(-)
MKSVLIFLFITIELLVHLHTTGPSSLQPSEQPEDSEVFDNQFIIYDISHYEDHLLKILPLPNIYLIRERYVQFPSCLATFDQVLNFDPSMVRFAISLVTFLNGAIENFSRFLNLLYSLYEKCYSVLENNLSEVSLTNSILDIFFNKSTMGKFIEMERAFMEYLNGFSFIIRMNTSISDVFSPLFSFFEDYIKSVYKLMVTPLLDTQSENRFIWFAMENPLVTKEITSFFLESFGVIVYKSVMNIFILFFENFVHGENNENGLKVREVLKENGLRLGFVSNIAEINEIIGTLFYRLENMAHIKALAQRLGQDQWEMTFVQNSIVEMSAICQLLSKITKTCSSCS